MDVFVTVPSERECPASLDWRGKSDEEDGVWVLSFGDLEREKTDVEVEFSIEQLAELREILNKEWDKGLFKQHLGRC